MELVANVEAVDKKYLEGGRQADDAESFVGMEEAHMSQVCSFEIPLTVSWLSHFFKSHYWQVYVYTWKINIIS